MARSPFLGTYQPNLRPVVVTAPDAMVLINNNSQVIGCPVCNKSFDINKYITSIQVDLSVDSVPGSASITCSVPRHTIDDFYFDNVPVITPMMEVNIYAKGFYLVQGQPQYYPIFWGLITEVNDDYSGGEHSVSIHCADILKWWELCRMNINPAYTSPTPSKFGLTLNGNSFAGMNPFDVIWTLAQSATGDIIQGGGSLLTLNVDRPQNPTFMPALSDVMAYWSTRFQNMTKNLLLFGTSGVSVRGDVLQAQNRTASGSPTTLASRTLRTASGNLAGGQTGAFLYDPTNANVVAFRTNQTNLGFNAWQNEYQTKLEIANAAKESIGYEFFMDVTGDIVFKPPFFNLDILSNKPVSWVQDIDVIDWSLSESEAEVITQLTMGGNYSGNVDWGMAAEASPFANVIDYHLLRKYGWRPAQMNSEYMGGGQDTLSMFYYGIDHLDRLNSKRHHGTVTIPFRPELRLGVPVYLASKDQIWYVQGISHNISFGGRATTSLTLVGKREKFKAPQGIGSITMTKYNPPAVGGTVTSSTFIQPLPGTSLFPYSGTQLSAGGVFKLKVAGQGGVAMLPFNPADLTPDNPSNNPYQPLILRDPQSGQILGYPNVVMVYLAPYYPNLGIWQSQSGQNTLSTIARLPAKSQKQATANQSAAATAQQAQLVANAPALLAEKYLSNVSQFGATSAGAFIYAHDLGTSYTTTGSAQGIIGEFIVVKAGNLTSTVAMSGDPESGSSGAPIANTAGVVIRPISDSRGFEVIGHYRYGRGVSLTDGQLVQQGGQANFQGANVALQVALSGNLLATLTAQSQGLTAVQLGSPAYPNPIQALATLEPTDLQTSGFTTPGIGGLPGSGSVTYGNTQPNFANLPVSGSPTSQGGFPSVEASQLSSGLTLAEMTVIDASGALDGTSSGQPQCMCLLGRSDLAFINTGYQVSNIQPTAPDNSALPNPNSPNPGASAQSTGPSTYPTGFSPASQSAYSQALQQGNPLNPTVSSSILTLSPTQVQTVIDNYLFSLISALDAPHQAYEAELRGGLYTAPQPGLSGTLTVGPGESALGATAPPFSAATAFAAGNPLAQAQMASSAAANLSQAWSSFSTTLSANISIAAMAQEIANAQSDLATLQSQLVAAQNSIPHTPASEIQSIQSQITTLMQSISTKSAQTDQARATVAAGPSIPQPVPGTPFPAMGAPGQVGTPPPPTSPVVPPPVT